MTTMEKETNDTQWEDIKVEYLPTVSLTNKAGKPGAELIGYFLSSRQVEYEYKGQKRKQKVHVFQLVSTTEVLTKNVDDHLINVSPSEKQKVEVWGAGQLDWFLSKISLGQKVKIVYKGKAMIDGQESHQFDFKVSKEILDGVLPF